VARWGYSPSVWESLPVSGALRRNLLVSQRKPQRVPVEAATIAWAAASRATGTR
jgi:hypothetical protein